MYTEEEYDFASMTTEQLAAVANSLDKRAKALEAMAADAKRELRERHPAGRRFEYGSVILEITRPKVFKEALARQLLTEEELAQISVSKVDGNLAKRKFGEDYYEAMTVPGTPRLTLKTE